MFGQAIAQLANRFFQIFIDFGALLFDASVGIELNRFADKKSFQAFTAIHGIDFLVFCPFFGNTFAPNIGIPIVGYKYTC